MPRLVTGHTFMKIWHISDTHGLHDMLNIPDGIDVICHTGDAGNSRDPSKSIVELETFFTWYSKLPGIKIYTPGNHDSAADCPSGKRAAEFNKLINGFDICYLNQESIEINGIKFFGTPFTPKWGRWAFMKDRDKMSDVWDSVPVNTDILLTHGPPKGMLDLAHRPNNNIERAGCHSLYRHITEEQYGWSVKYVLFGHIHDHEMLYNNGVLIRDGITYSNGSVVEDGKFGEIKHNGNIIQI